MKLIINADDFGIDIDRDFGIFFCSLFKLITSTSVIVTNRLTAIRKKMVKVMHKRISVGIHINLTDSPLITCNMQDLCFKNYDMREKHIFWKNCLMDTINMNAIKTEIEKQIQVFYENFSFIPDYIDFHNHTNIFNKNIQEFAKHIANKYGVVLRIPYEEYNVEDLKYIAQNEDIPKLMNIPKNLNEIIKKFEFYCKYDMILYNYLCKNNCSNYKFKFIGSVYGYYRKAFKFYEQIQMYLKDDIVQFMTHPGFYTHLVRHKSTFSNFDRLNELVQLFKIQRYCKKNNIILCSYKDIKD